MANFLVKALTKALGGSKSDKDMKQLKPIVEAVNKFYTDYKNLSNDELRAKTSEFKKRISDHTAKITEQMVALEEEAKAEGKSLQEREDIYTNIDELQKEKDKQYEEILNQIMPEAFAVVKETSRRFTEKSHKVSTATDLDREFAQLYDFVTIEGDKAIYAEEWDAAGANISWNMVHYDVQLIGGAVLHSGKISEMATGEGKTLVSTLPAYLNALTGEGVHLITVNNYLAKRDQEWNRPLFAFLGLTTDCIDKYQPHSEGRRKAYRSDITYGTNNEFGFDYLRDNMVHAQDDRVQAKHHFAMIDEVDSVLIDDARTPLIISGPVAGGDDQAYEEFNPRILKLYQAQVKLAQGFLNDAKKLIAEGKNGPKEGGLALLRAYRSLPKYNPLIKFLSEDGMKTLLLKAEAYYLQDQAKEMPFVDQELYFTIEEKNNQVELKDKGLELITKSSEDEHFFVMPDLSTELAAIEEKFSDKDEQLKAKDALVQEYSVKADRIHTVNQLLKAYALFAKDVEYVVMENKVKIVDEQTGRIMEGRRYSDGLHQAIEAKEGVKVEAATQTYATVSLQNYFRMYHKLGGMTGTAITEAGEFWDIYKLDVVEIPTNRPIARKDENDLVYKTKKDKFKAIIDEVVKLKNQGRPVLVGTTSVEVSELLSRLLKVQGIQHNVLNAKQHQREAEIVAEAGNAGMVTIATNMAGRGTDIKLSEEVKAAGGLAIIGSERHDSRRVDRQLRGRAGRQGDPGSSQFFVSLEDNLMRLFMNDRVAKMMDRFGLKEGEVIQHSMVTNSIEKAQKKVEENNFGVRKHLLEYDDVMNTQRELIYKKRSHALSGKRLAVDLYNSFYDKTEEIAEEAAKTSDYDQFELQVIRNFAIQSPVTEEEFKSIAVNELTEKLFAKAVEAYTKKMEAIREMALPVFQRIQQEQPNAQFVTIPFQDGYKGLNIRINVQEAVESDGKAIRNTLERTIALLSIDNAWKSHLRKMDELRQSVQNVRYEQKDPLLIYKFEAFKLFDAMLSELNSEIASFLFKAMIPTQQPGANQAQESTSPQIQVKESRVDERREAAKKVGASVSKETAGKQEPATATKKPKPNDECYCGSGLKYKKCHGRAKV